MKVRRMGAGLATLAIAPTLALSGCEAQKPQCALTQPQTASQVEKALSLRGPTWAGADLASSVALPDGRTLWLYGDTFVGPVDATGQRATSTVMVRNSALVMSHSCVTPLLSGTKEDPHSWIRRTDSPDKWYWLGAAVVTGDLLRVFLMKMQPGGPIGTATGMAVATLSLPDLKLISTEPVPSDGEHLYGIATAQDKHYTYAWGTGGSKEPFTFGKQLYVSRTVTGAFGQRWEFWTGKTWSTRPSKAAPLTDPILATQLSIHPYRGGYLAVSKEYDFMGTDVIAWWAKRPQGPWKKRKLLKRIPMDKNPKHVHYMVTAHPEIQLADGKLLVSVNKNTFDLKEHRNAFVYGAEFFAAPLDFR